MSERIKPAVDRETITEFLEKVRDYIDENPVVIPSGKQTWDLFGKRPSLHVPCQARSSGECPQQDSEHPSCNKCAHADAAIEILQEVAPSLGFQVDSPNKFSGIGTISQGIGDTSTGDRSTLTIKGDKQGQVSFSLNRFRRPYTTEEEKLFG